MGTLSNKTMLEVLAKVQQRQIEILNTGRSCHVDAGVHYNCFDTGEHISFNVTVFEENTLDRSFDFYHNMTKDELEAEYARLAAYVNRIKTE